MQFNYTKSLTSIYMMILLYIYLNNPFIFHKITFNVEFSV